MHCTWIVGALWYSVFCDPMQVQFNDLINGQNMAWMLEGRAAQLFPGWFGKKIDQHLGLLQWHSIQVVNYLPANAEDTGEASLIPELDDPLKKKMATHSSILSWRIPWTGEPGRLQSMGSQRVGHN